MNKYQSLLKDVHNALLRPPKKSISSNVVSLVEGCDKSQLLQQKVRTHFLCPLTSKINLYTIEKFSTLHPEKSLHLHFKYQSLSCVYLENKMKHMLRVKEKILEILGIIARDI